MFKDKVVVITGGGSGIGLAVAQELDKQGAKLALFGRNSARLEKAAKSMKAAIAVQGDVSRISDLDNLYQTTKNKFGSIDIILANAGIAQPRHLKEVDERFFDEMVSINYKGVYFTVQRSLPYIKDGGAIVLVSSIAGHLGWPTHSVYGSTKAAVSYLAKGFAADLISRKIRVNAISPGFTDSSRFTEIKENHPEQIERITENIPMGKFASVDEIVTAILLLASPLTPSLTGSDLILDGGTAAIFPAKT